MTPLDAFNPYAAPEAEIVLTGQGLRTGEGPWREGNLLVLEKGTELPDRCLKCNAPAGGYRLRRNLSWHPPWVYILGLSPIIYIIVALLIRKTAKVGGGLCEAHRKTRRRVILTAWVLILAGLGLAVFAGNRNLHGGVMAFGLIGALVVLIWAVLSTRVLDPARITKQAVWLKGVCPAFLDEQPVWVPLVVPAGR